MPVKVERDCSGMGCAKLIDAVLDCDAIVYGDNEVNNETVSDASYVTSCSEKVSKNCCNEVPDPIP